METVTVEMLAAFQQALHPSKIITLDEILWWPMEPDNVIVPRIEGKHSNYLDRMIEINRTRLRQYEWIDYCLNTAGNRPYVFYKFGPGYLDKGFRYGLDDFDRIVWSA